MSKGILDMTPEERQAVRDANPPVVDGIHYGGCYFDWGWRGCGFGQLEFSYDRDTGKLEVMNECMSRDSVRKILHALADFIADRATLSDNPEDIPPVDFAAEREKARLEFDEWERTHGRI